MENLWKDPKLVATLLINSDKNDIKESLAPLFADNFYENILSSSYIEDNLMYVISLLLKDEVDKLKSVNDWQTFLDDTPCGYLLEQLRMKQDIQTFFKNTIYSVVESLEISISASETMNFNVKQIQDDFSKTKEEIEKEFTKTGKKLKKIDGNFYKKIIDDNFTSYGGSEGCVDDSAIEKEEFNSKYMPSLTKDEIYKQLKENEKNQKMSDFFKLQFNYCQKNSTIFSNDGFLGCVFESSMSKEVLASYQIDFMRMLKLIDLLIKQLLNNLYLLPYSVKCICKMISILIKKKFPSISITEQNSFVSKFFVSKLFAPVFENPGIWALINNFIISSSTKYNLKIISYIVKQIFSGRFFINDEQNSNYTPFNWYIIEKMPSVFKFFDYVTKITLPSFIEKFVNNELNNTFEFDYFRENPDEVVFHRSICFSFDGLLALIKNMNKCKDVLFANEKNNFLKKTLERLANKSGMENLEAIKKNIEYEKIYIPDPKKKKEPKVVNGRPILKYILLTELLYSGKYAKYFKIKQDKPSFTLNELPETITEEDSLKNNVIKVKNFLCTLLYNYRMLVKTEFDEGTTINLISILKELKKFMKISNFVIDDTIPSEWYVDSLLEYFKKIPRDMLENDFDKLFRQIESSLNVSIKDLDFEALSDLLGKVKFVKRGQNYYINTIKSLVDSSINEKVQYIIEKEPISVDLLFRYNNKYKELKIEKSSKKEMQLQYLDNMIFEEDSQKNIFCRTIKAFAKKFPNLSNYQTLKDISILDLERELKLTKKINGYFSIVREYLSNTQNIKNESTFNQIYNRIYDYVMEKLYDKLIKKDPEPKDNEIYNQCVVLSWTEPKHFMDGKVNYVFDSFLPDVINYFKQIDIQKSPRQKFIYMHKIFASIENVVKFNGGKELGEDDALPIFNYAFIKAQPPHMCSNCNYMDLFLGERKNGENSKNLTELRAACNFVTEINYTKLNGVTEEQYKKRCASAFRRSSSAFIISNNY